LPKLLIVLLPAMQKDGSNHADTDIRKIKVL
jgi:hypothetical protein